MIGKKKSIKQRNGKSYNILLLLILHSQDKMDRNKDQSRKQSVLIFHLGNLPPSSPCPDNTQLIRLPKNKVVD